MLFLRNKNETAGRPAIREVSGSSISESRPTCGMGRAHEERTYGPVTE
ncbi:MAG TPA: hypothetical protein VFY68_06865 [Nitrososphaeraceae archaeon]|nr:hypothetical protein [Nitrososphaeraceae archaeon]